MDSAANNDSDTWERPERRDGPLSVTAEEVGLVLLVLLLWLVAIALFINRWGKIRMLEPYLPAYKMTPRETLTVPVNGGSTFVHLDSAKRASRRKHHLIKNIDRNCDRNLGYSIKSSRINSLDDDAVIFHYMQSQSSPSRPRQNSLMVPITSQLTAARKVKSAVDLVSLVIAEQREQRDTLTGGIQQTNV